jgi:hypothetical protein
MLRKISQRRTSEDFHHSPDTSVKKIAPNSDKTEATDAGTPTEDGEIIDKERVPTPDRLVTPENCYAVEELPGISVTSVLEVVQHEGVKVYTYKPEIPRTDYFRY